MGEAPYQPTDRRPIASRDLTIMQNIAGRLARRRVSPNAISISSVFFALSAGVALAATGWTASWAQRACWLAAAALVQLRLLANLFDGMVAIESKTASPVGELYNEVPDRLSDTAILIGLGLAPGGSLLLGCLAAIVALFVAYARAVGAAAGVGQVFIGPMAKPHRMAVVTVASLYAAIAPLGWQPVLPATGWGVPALVLAIIILGGILTSIRRLSRIARKLREPAT